MTSPRTRAVLLSGGIGALTAVVLAASIAFAVGMDLSDGATAVPADPGTTAPAAPTPEPTPEVTPTPAPEPTADETGTPDPGHSTTYDTATIQKLLTQVRVLPTRPQVDGYDRDCGPGEGCVFGPSWTDDSDAPDGRNGCDTRNDVLAAELEDVRFKAGSNDCDVVAGHFVDPYLNQPMTYETEGSQIHIDHLFPLSAAWDLGAAEWTLEKRTAFANDTELELLAVNGSANMSKGDSTPASWLPPNNPYRCEYLTRYLQVAIAYGLAVTAADVTVTEAAARKC